MGKKLSLPLLDVTRRPESAPTIERGRQRLGGTGSTDLRAGTPVRDASGAVGIVLYAFGDDLDVLVGNAGVVRRSTAAQWDTLDAVPPELRAIATMIAQFAELGEGDRVAFENGRIAGEGLLFEKCRYGGLVARDDGSILAVGYASFRPVRSAVPS